MEKQQKKIGVKGKGKCEDGITLIVLVVMIIILLILAGISISMLTGQNGILNRAGEAKEKTENASEKEQIQLAYTSASMKSVTRNDTISVNDIQNELNSLLGQNKATVTSCGKGFDILINDKNYYYTIEGDGTIEDPIEVIEIQYAGDITKNGQYDGSTLEKAYRIECIEDLVAFSIESKNNVYANKYIRLTRNLNFDSKYSYQDWERIDFGNLNGDNTDGNKLMNEMTTGTGCLEIGNTRNGFEGIFDGNGYTLNNIYQNLETECGLFFFNKGTITNLNITGELKTNKQAGGIAYRNWGTIFGCSNYANISTTIDESYNAVGGIVGENIGIISNCSNHGNINSFSNAGGIVGININNSININCYNTGTITSSGILDTRSNSGGIIRYK